MLPGEFTCLYMYSVCVCVLCLDELWKTAVVSGRHTEALCLEVCLSATLFLLPCFRFFFLSLTDTPIPGISRGFYQL